VHQLVNKRLWPLRSYSVRSRVILSVNHSDSYQLSEVSFDWEGKSALCNQTCDTWWPWASNLSGITKIRKHF